MTADPKPLTDEELRTIGLMDGGVSIFTVRRLLATLAARDAEIERLKEKNLRITAALRGCSRRGSDISNAAYEAEWGTGDVKRLVRFSRGGGLTEWSDVQEACDAAKKAEERDAD